MGTATVIANRGEGLYTVTLNYNTAKLDKELLKLQKRQTEHWAEMLRALDSLNLLRQEKAEAKEGMNAVVQQWIDGLIDRINAMPPPIPPPVPNDPNTGLPWVDPDRAQDAPLFAAMNAARSAAGVPALTRIAALDTGIIRHLKAMDGSGVRGGHFDTRGTKPPDRAAQAGYLYNPAVGVGELLAPGADSPAACIIQWQRTSIDRNILIHPDYSECGVAFVSAPSSLYGYLWGALLSGPGTAGAAVTIDKDPAKQAADKADAELKRVPIPSVTDVAPNKLAEVAGTFGIASAKVRVAEDQVARLRIEYHDRAQRILELTAIKAGYGQPVDVWACMWEERAITVGSTVAIAEIPGFFSEFISSRVTTMGVRDDPNFTVPDVAVGYVEHPINIVPSYRFANPGKLKSAVAMSDAEMFVNAALEPGHLRWKPLWRYGTITALAGNYCSLTLDSQVTLRGADAAELELDSTAQQTLVNVPISYPPCSGEVFQVGDSVLILYEGFNRDAPKVIGFRREPRPCPGGRQSWEQL